VLIGEEVSKVSKTLDIDAIVFVLLREDQIGAELEGVSADNLSHIVR